MDLERIIEILKYSSKRTRKIGWKEEDYTTPICDSMVRGMKMVNLNKQPPIPLTQENISYILNNESNHMFDWQRKYVYTIGQTEHTDKHLKSTPIIIIDSIDDNINNNNHVTIIFKDNFKTTILSESNKDNINIYFNGYSADNIQSWSQKGNNRITPKLLPKTYFKEHSPKNATYHVLKYQASQVPCSNPVQDYILKTNEQVLE